MSIAVNPQHCSAQTIDTHTLRLTFFFLATVWITVLHAQPNPPGFRHFTADDGLPSSEVYEVLQDHKGYLWFSTDNGVTRFNGIEFQNFGALQGLSESVVFNMQEDKQGRIWMQSMTGRLFVLENDSIRPFAGNRVVDSLNIYQISALDFFVDSTGAVYNSINSAGIIRFAPGSDKGRFLTTGLSVSAVYMVGDRPLASQCYDILHMENVKAYDKPFRDRGVRVFKLYHRNSITIDTLPDNNSIDYFNSHAFHDGTTLIYRNGYLFSYKKNKLAWVQKFPAKVISWHQNSVHELYFGMNDRQGVRIYRNMQDVFSGNYKTILNGYSITHILKDREGGLWFTTNEAGVFYQPNPSVQIYNQDSGLPLDAVTTLALVNEHELYLGFDGKGVVKLDALSNNVTNMVSDQARVDDMFFDEAHQELWVAGKTYLGSFKEGKWYILEDTARSRLLHEKIGYAARHFHSTSDKKWLWIVHHSGFLKLKIDQSPNYILQSDKNILGQAVLPTRTYDICTNSLGHTYISNFNGLFELVNNELKRLPILHPSFLTRVEAIEELRDSTIVLGTKGYGLVFWKGDSVASLTEQDGLTANMIENLNLDADNNLWVGTLNGLNRVRWRWGAEPEIRNITTAHGLPSNEITDVQLMGEHLWVSTIGGLAHFQNGIKQTVLPPIPILERWWANETLQALPTDDRAHIVLRSHERNLRMQFVSLQYANARNIIYRYRLHSTDPWIIGRGRTLNFSTLSDGEYELEIQARNADRIWSQSAILHFTIPPFWWETWWFIAAMILAIIGFLYAAYDYRTRQLSREKDIRQQMTELEYSALQAQMNPHFIFNCLNSIQNFILQNEKDEAIEYLNGFARLVRGMLNASVDGSISLFEEINLLENYLLLEQLRFNHRFVYTVKALQDVDLLGIKIPPLLIQPYVENAVLHGISDRAGGGKVEIGLERKEEFLVAIIQDNGKGIASNMKDGPTKRTPQKSVGMTITSRRLELLSKLRNDQAVETVSLRNEADEIIGTKVTIRIKIDTNEFN